MHLIVDSSKISGAMFQAFINDISKDFVPPLLGNRTIDYLFNRVRRHPTSVFCIDEDELIAMADITLKKEKHYAYIELLGVCRNHRRKHIATELIRRAIAETESLGIERIGVHTNNEYALELYQKMGFKKQLTTFSEEIQYPHTHRYYLEYLFAH